MSSPNKSPLILGAESGPLLRLTIESHDVAHVIVDGLSQLELEIRPHAKIYLYWAAKKTDSIETASLDASLAEHAQLDFFELGLFGSHRQQSRINLDGAYSTFRYFGLDKLCEEQHKNSHLTVIHRAPHSSSVQQFRGVYREKSCGVFFGQVQVEKAACHAKAHQHYKAILLDKNARAHVMPQLKIYNPDISASHGASIGELDKEALFYLCSRGLNEKEAQAMLLLNYLEDILQHIEEPNIKATFSEASLRCVQKILR